MSMYLRHLPTLPRIGVPRAAIDEYDALYPQLKAGELKVTVLVTWQDQDQASANDEDKV